MIEPKKAVVSPIDRTLGSNGVILILGRQIEGINFEGKSHGIKIWIILTKWLTF